MKEIVGDLFSQSCDAICITTNGEIKSNGLAVMGAGVAKQAANRWPVLPLVLAQRLKTIGLQTTVLTYPGPQVLSRDKNGKLCYNSVPYHIVALPTKREWRNDSDIELIETSIRQLVQISDEQGWKRVMLTRPGCGLGGLNWSSVKATLATVPGFDDRFSVVTPN